MRVDGDTPTAVRFEANCREVQVLHGSLASNGVEQRVTRNALVAFQVGHNAAIGNLFHAGDLFVQTHRDAPVAQVIRQSFDYFRIGEFQQARPLLDQDHANAQHGEHAGIFNTDDASPHYDQRFRDLRHVQDLVAIENVASVDRHQRRTSRPGSGSNNDERRFELKCGRGADHPDVRLVQKRGSAAHHVDSVP